MDSNDENTQPGIQISIDSLRKNEIESRLIQNQEFEVAFEKGDLRLAEALSENSRISFINRAKINISKGEYVEAEALLLKQQMPSRRDETRLKKGELELLRAKLFSAKGDWTECLNQINRLSASEFSLVQKIEFYCVRLAARFETKDFEGAHRDIELIISLSALASNTLSLITALVYRARIRARQIHPDAGMADLDEVWRSHFDYILTDFRAVLDLLNGEIDVLRLAGRPFAQQSIACYHIARHSYDPLRAAVALSDIHFAFRGHSHDILTKELSRARDK
jgi:hypothetical protein